MGSTFLVITDERPTVPRASAVWAADESPLDPRQIWGYANWHEPLPPPTAFHSIITAPTDPERPPRAVQRARAYARSLATEHSGVLVDWAAREIVLLPSRPERAAFVLSDQWLGFDHDVDETRHGPSPPRACRALRVGTRGLARFGRTELVIGGVDCQHHLVALNALRALAQHVFVAGDGRQPGSLVRVPAGAFAAYWGASWIRGRAFRVSLTESNGRLQVGAPHGEPINEWLARLGGSLPWVASCPPDDYDSYVPLTEVVA